MLFGQGVKKPSPIEAATPFRGAAAVDRIVVGMGVGGTHVGVTSPLAGRGVGEAVKVICGGG